MTRLAMLLAAAALPAGPALAEKIFVSNEKGNTVTVLDGETHEVIHTIEGMQRPRGITASPDGTNVYLITEFSGEVVRFARDPRSGRLTPAESVLVHDPSAGLAHSRYGADPLEEHLIWCADVWTAGGGRWVLGTERTVSTVATVAVDEAGRLGDVVALTRTEEQPRGMAVSPDGSLVVVVGERSGHASLYEMGSDGSLALLDRAETGDGPNWVRFV